MARMAIGLLCLLAIGAAQAERWVYRYGAPLNGGGARSIVCLADGNLYAGGEGWDSGSPVDFTIISLTTTGEERWVYRYDGPGSGEDRAYSIVSGADGNLYAAGYSTGSGTHDDFTVIGLTSSGGERWAYRYNAPGDGDDWAYSVIYGEDGYVYAAGFGYAGLTVVRLTPTGDERWVYLCPRGIAKSVVYGIDGNVYTAGWSQGSGPYDDFTVISLDPAIGVEEWSQRRPEQAQVVPSVAVRGTAFAVTSWARDAKVTILDASGRVVAMPGSGVWHTATVAPGAYFVYIRSGTRTVVRKVLVVE
jgi:hypothetical protein